ncbi:MAG: NosD domain-containing protein [Candidatus Bathyarchaeia archaeon]
MAASSKVFLVVGFLLVVTFLAIFSGAFCSRGSFVALASDANIVVNPGQSISAALSSASQGDTILLMTGTYSQSQISVNKTVTITGEDPERTIIDGGGTASDIFMITADNVVIENLTVENTDSSFAISAPAVYLFNATGVHVENLMIKKAFFGLQFTDSNSSMITYCTISETFDYGVFLRDRSCNNTFFGNTIENNSDGMVFSDATCQFNRVYNNNFIGNLKQLQFFGTNYFDDGYPSGGNYWSDAVGTDLKSGPDQNEVGGDGILDQGYPESSAWDRYPLDWPITNLQVTVGAENFVLQVSTNSTLTGCYLNGTAKTVGLLLNASENLVGSCRITIPKGFLSTDNISEWKVAEVYLNGTSLNLPYWAAEDSENTYAYFTYTQSEVKEIDVTGTLLVDEFFDFMILAFMFVSVGVLVLWKSLRKRKSSANVFKPLFKELCCRLTSGPFDDGVSNRAGLRCSQRTARTLFEIESSSLRTSYA